MYQDKTYNEAVSACSAMNMTLFVTNSTEDSNAISKFTDINWPYGKFWVNGKSGSNCSILSNDKRVNYTKTESPCTTKTYFHCEFESNLKLYFLDDKMF